jgi:hypothetical protein
MKEFVIRLLVAAVLTLAALALSSSAQGQSAEGQSKTAGPEHRPKRSSRIAISGKTIHLETSSVCPNPVSCLAQLNQSTSFRLR